MQSGRARRGKSMMIKSARSKYPASRIAVIVSKKIYKSAVKRNRIRRRIYNIVRHELSRYNPASTDIIITVFSKDVLIMPTTYLHDEIVQLLQSAVQRDHVA